jgi:transcriptional regulator with XRE-family HTH domain
MNTNVKEIGNNIKTYRKLKKLSLLELGNMIFKSKGTISKYEKGSIALDIITLMEICNALDIHITQLLENDITSNTDTNSNPFNTNKLFMYYYIGTENKIRHNIIELFNVGNDISARLFNNVNNYNNYRENYEYSYSGNMITDNTISFISLKNNLSNHIQLENVEIIINIPWTKKFHITNGLLTALTPNAVPVSFKIIISDKIITNKKKLMEKLKFTKEDLQNIKNSNRLYIDPQYLDDYFDDIL